VDAADRFRLLGKYRTPRVRVGGMVRCEIRGEIEVGGFTDRPIPWLKGKTKRRPAIIVYGGLAQAIHRESKQAVAHWWGVKPLTVWQWRKALGVGATTPGTSRLRSDYAQEPWAIEAQAAIHARAIDPERRDKIAATTRGKARPRRRGHAAGPHRHPAQRRDATEDKRNPPGTRDQATG
jgi:hypothetical protein